MNCAIKSVAIGACFTLALVSCGGGGGGASRPTTSQVVAPMSGSLDSSFGVDGYAMTDMGSEFDESQALAIQSDGKIVVAGAVDGGSTDFDFAVARYNADGTLDSSFHHDGKAVSDFNGSYDFSNAVAIYPNTGQSTDGKIVVAGTAKSSAGAKEFALLRYNADGSLDETDFNAASSIPGRVTTTFTGATEASIKAIAIQSDGKIVAAGIAANSTKYYFALSRYNVDGSLDKDFSGNGKTTNDFNGSSYNSANAIAIYPDAGQPTDGKIVAVGYTTDIYNRSVMVVARYNNDGSLDTANFGNGNGFVIIPGFTGVLETCAIQGDGKIVVAGSAYSGGGYPDIIVARLLQDGSLDDSSFAGFGTSGVTLTNFHYLMDEAYGVVVQKDKKIVVTGFAQVGSSIDYDIVIVRYDEHGNVDRGFGVDGAVELDLGSMHQSGTAIALQDDGKIVTTMSPIVTDNGEDFALVRVNP